MAFLQHPYDPVRRSIKIVIEVFVVRQVMASKGTPECCVNSSFFENVDAIVEVLALFGLIALLAACQSNGARTVPLDDEHSACAQIKCTLECRASELGDHQRLI